MSRLECTITDKKTNKVNKVGFMEIKNKSEEKAELYIYGDIVRDEWYKWSDTDVCPQDITDFLKELDKAKDLDIFINSGGGSVHGGLAIYNQLKRHSGFKTVHIDGIAASIASVIACAADKIVIPSTAQFMIHKPSVMIWENMNADDLRREAESLDVCQETILNVYENKLKEGVTREDINELVNAETWFTGETVTNYFDFITDESNEAVASISSMYKNYKNTPKDLKTRSFFNAEKQNKPLKSPAAEIARSLEGFENFGKSVRSQKEFNF